MPTKSFYQLSGEKRRKLLDAAVEEFSTTPYEKVSVFKIARSAGISRSGFYYYFQNKSDLYAYIYFELIQNDFINYMNSLEEKCDIFRVFESRFEYYLSIKGTPNEALIKQMIQNLKSYDLFKVLNEKPVSLFSGIEKCEQQNERFNTLFSFFESLDTSALTVESREDILALVMLINTITLKYVSSYFDGKITIEEATQGYKRYEGYIKNGFVKHNIGSF